MIIEGLQLWNKATNEEYKKLMEGATTNEEKDERIQDAVSFIKNQVNEEGTNVRDASLRFASYMKEIRDVVCRICLFITFPSHTPFFRSPISSVVTDLSTLPAYWYTVAKTRRRVTSPVSL
jgi:hypothetical protein